MKKEYWGDLADVWAVGVVMFALASGVFPFRSPIEWELYRKIIKGTFDFPPHVSINTRQMIEKLLVSDPQKRPTADLVLLDPYFRVRPVGL